MTTKKSRTIGMLTVCLAVAACIGTASADWVTTTVSAGSSPCAVAVNPVTNKTYVANSATNNVTVIDGATSDTTLVASGSYPLAVAVNPVTNKIYVANNHSNSVTVIDGATNSTTLVAADSQPIAVAVNPVTNRIYVANYCSKNVTVIDGATNDTTLVSTGSFPRAVAVNPVTNKIYVVNCTDDNVTVIDGATNSTTTVAAGTRPYAVAVNPVTNNIYVPNMNSANVTVIDGATNDTTLVPAGLTPVAVAVIRDAPTNDTKVRVAFDRLPGDTTGLGRPTLTGKGVNRSTPGRTAMMGICNRLNTAQTGWDWATVTSGAGTDSITWTYNWGTDSLILGENFVCAVPLEDQAATTDNLGLGSPFAGNFEVYPVYRVEYHGGTEEMTKPEVRMTELPTIVRGALYLPAQGDGRMANGELLDISGRAVMPLRPGPNDVSRLAPGVYFVLEAQAQAVRKVVVQR